MATAREYLQSAVAGLTKLGEMPDQELELNVVQYQQIDDMVYDLLEYDGPEETPPTDAESEKERRERLTKEIPK